MIDIRILQRAIITGTVLQIAMTVAGHFFPWVVLYVFLFGGMMISATVGYLYAMDFAHGYGRGALGGAIAGGVCAMIGIAVSVLLRDVPAQLLPSTTSICTLTGAVGGVFGQIAAWMRGPRF